MAWVRLDDQFANHPKIVAAGPLAGWLYICSLCYAGQYLTDGFIPAAQVKRLADIDEVTPLVTVLLTNYLWEETDGGYLIHDWNLYNPPAAKVKEQRAKNAKRQADWKNRHLPLAGNDGNAVSNTVTNEVANGVSNTCPVPTPVPIPINDPDLNKDPEIGKEKKARKTAFTAPDGATAKSVFAALCELTGEDAANATKRNVEKATRSANDMLRKGHTQDQILRCYRWIVSDPWWRDKADMSTIAGKIDRWIALGEPVEQSTNGRKPSVQEREHERVPAKPNRHVIVIGDAGGTQGQA